MAGNGTGLQISWTSCEYLTVRSLIVLRYKVSLSVRSVQQPQASRSKVAITHLKRPISRSMVAAALMSAKLDLVVDASRTSLIAESICGPFIRLSVKLDHILAVLEKYSPSSLIKTADSEEEMVAGGGVGGEPEDIFMSDLTASRYSRIRVWMAGEGLELSIPDSKTSESGGSDMVASLKGYSYTTQSLRSVHLIRPRPDAFALALAGYGTLLTSWSRRYLDGEMPSREDFFSMEALLSRARRP